MEEPYKTIKHTNKEFEEVYFILPYDEGLDHKKTLIGKYEQIMAKILIYPL